MQTGLGTVRLEAAVAELGRRDAVEDGGLVQADERIGVQPVTARAVPAVDDHHLYIGVVDQGVGERQARGTGADHQIVGVQRVPHGRTLLGLSSSPLAFRITSTMPSMISVRPKSLGV